MFSWQSAIVIDLDSPGQLGGHRFSEKFASNLGILISLLSAAFSVFFATIMDRLKYKYKYKYKYMGTGQV